MEVQLHKDLPNAKDFKGKIVKVDENTGYSYVPHGYISNGNYLSDGKDWLYIYSSRKRR